MQQVEVLRIKNRMKPPQQDGSRAASSSRHAIYQDDQLSTCVTGYRDLAINLKLAGAQAETLSLKSHICEVQLLLIQFAYIKSDYGHSRYVNWRNCRGE